jgi:hypothetical protein
MRVRL